MSRDAPLPGGDLELALLAALWDPRSEARTVRDLHEVVGKARGIVYTTVAKVLDRMVDKRLVARKRRGRAYVYRPLVDRRETQRTLVRQLLARLVGDDPRPAVAALVGAVHDVSPDLLDELAAELATRRKGSDGT